MYEVRACDPPAPSECTDWTHDRLAKKPIFPYHAFVFPHDEWKTELEQLGLNQLQTNSQAWINVVGINPWNLLEYLVTECLQSIFCEWSNMETWWMLYTSVTSTERRESYSTMTEVWSKFQNSVRFNLCTVSYPYCSWDTTRLRQQEAWALGAARRAHIERTRFIDYTEGFWSWGVWECKQSNKKDSFEIKFLFELRFTSSQN